VARQDPQSYDVIVVGSGSAGAVVTRRLVDAGARVLLLEAGGPDENPAIHDPARIWELWDGPDDWAYKTVPQTGCAGRVLDIPRGKVLGGSTSLNGMIYIRGHRSDYDHWAYLGNQGWTYEDVLPLFKRSEDFDRGESEFHGAGGELPVVADYEPHPFHASAVEAAQEAGVPFNPDHNGAELDGVGFAQLMIKDGRRQSAAVTFLRPVLDRPNLTVWTSARAHRLLFEGDRCLGVEYRRDGQIGRANAEHEVVVSGGTLESPKLLLLSGIGDPSELGGLGIDVVVGLPGVGKNLHDHSLSPVIYSASRALPPIVPGTQAIHSHLFARTKPGLVGPDTQPLFFQVPAYLPGMDGPGDGFTIMAGLIRPASRGSLRLASTELDDPPLVDPAYLAQEADVDVLESSLRLCREIGESSALDEWRSEELYPGPSVTSRAQVRDYIRRTAITYHHQVGTCKMGTDALAVVDPELRVYGVTGLRVADASIMPAVTSGNTHAPATMIGERAADLVREALGVTSDAEGILV
jgi:choline dehydrogenase-like flavoprotein